MKDLIYNHWHNNAESYGRDHKASWSDINCINLEINMIKNYLKNGDRIFDVGCGNGYSLLRYASHRKVKVKGVDYIPKMIKSANESLKEIKTNSDIEFQVGNILSLKEADNSYNVVIATRIFCNLLTTQEKLKGLSECIRIIKSGGMLLLLEPTLQGWNKLNIFRKEWNLKKIKMPVFNKYLDEDWLIKNTNLTLEEVKNFSSSYYVMTRIIKPLFSYARGMENNVVNPNLEWNNFSALLPAVGDYGIQKLFIFTK